MQMLLRNLLTELHQRCLTVKDILSNGVFLTPADAYALTLYIRVEHLRSDVNRLLQDPALGSPPLLPRQFLSDSAAYGVWEQKQWTDLHPFLQQP